MKTALTAANVTRVIEGSKRIIDKKEAEEYINILLDVYTQMKELGYMEAYLATGRDLEFMEKLITDFINKWQLNIKVNHPIPKGQIGEIVIEEDGELREVEEGPEKEDKTPEQDFIPELPEKGKPLEGEVVPDFAPKANVTPGIGLCINLDMSNIIGLLFKESPDGEIHLPNFEMPVPNPEEGFYDEGAQEEEFYGEEGPEEKEIPRQGAGESPEEQEGDYEEEREYDEEDYYDEDEGEDEEYYDEGEEEGGYKDEEELKSPPLICDKHCRF